MIVSFERDFFAGCFRGTFSELSGAMRLERENGRVGKGSNWSNSLRLRPINTHSIGCTRSLKILVPPLTFAERVNLISL